MNKNEFREFAHEAIDFLIDYFENLRDRQVLPSVKPGYLKKLLPIDVPEQPENWKDVMQDVHSKIMPGLTHWQSPNFHAFYPVATSYPSIVGEIIGSGMGVLGITWISSPACTELEMIVMDWIANLLGLPKEFLNTSEGPGGGVIQGSASEAILMVTLTAREQSVKRLQAERPDLTEGEIRSKLIMYTSDQCNGAIEKAALSAAVKIRLLPTDKKGALRGNTLKIAVEEDIENGKFPIICIATLGTTPTCAFDNLNEIGSVCGENKIWLHVDAAYAAAALCCPESRYLMPGIEFADSFNFSMHKWMMLQFDCAALWMKDTSQVVDALTVDRDYLKHHFEGAPDFRHFQFSLGRRFRALKVWFTLRLTGAEKIREKIRKDVQMASKFADLVSTDSRFEIATEQALGLVCFRLKGECTNTQSLLSSLVESKNIFMVSTNFQGQTVIRFVVCGIETNESDIEFAWNEIKTVVDKTWNANVSSIGYHRYGEIVYELLDEFKNKFSWRIDGKDSIIDIGCAGGDMTNDYILPILPPNFERLIGVDSCEKMIAYAEETYSQPKIEFKQFNIATDCSKQLEQVDHVISMYCFHMISDHKKAVRNVYDLLKPNGDCLIVFLADVFVLRACEYMARNTKWGKHMNGLGNLLHPNRNSKSPEVEFKRLLMEHKFWNCYTEIREKKIVFDDMNQFKIFLKAVNPFYERIPTLDRDNYFNDFLQLMLTFIKSDKNHKQRNDDDPIFLPIPTIVAYAKKYN